MKNIIDRMYIKNSDNLFKNVNKFEYEVRELTNKKDTAELFIRVASILTALEKEGIKVEFPPENQLEEMINKAIEEDREQINIDIADSLFEARQDRKMTSPGVLDMIKYYIEEFKIRYGNLDNNIKNYYKENLDALSDDELDAFIQEYI